MTIKKSGFDRLSRKREIYVDEENKLFVITGLPAPHAGKMPYGELSKTQPFPEDRTYLGLVPFSQLNKQEQHDIRRQAKPLDSDSHITTRVNIRDRRLEYLDGITFTVTQLDFSALESDVRNRLERENPTPRGFTP